MSVEQVKAIRSDIDKLEWFDGSMTSGAGNKVSQTAYKEGDVYSRIDNTLVNEFFDDLELTYMTQPKSINNTTISKMCVGGFYGLHTDSPELGHYSTTTFLADPTEYMGGQLKLYVNGEVVEMKLPAGWAVTYLTGIPHCVEPVTDGTRLVCVNWTTSMISSPVVRDIVSDLHKCRDLLSNEPTSGDFHSDLNSPRHITSELYNKMIRNYGLL